MILYDILSTFFMACVIKIHYTQTINKHYLTMK